MLTQSVPTKKQTFDEFVNWYPENSLVKYELRDGEIIEVPQGSGRRSQVWGNIRGNISLELRRLNLPYSIPGHCIVKMPGKDTGYQPNIIVLDAFERSPALADEPRWKGEAIIQNASSIRLVVELVDDFEQGWELPCIWKCIDYKEMRVPEYWIVDLQNKVKFEGDNNSDGHPLLLVISLVDGEYQTKRFAGDEAIKPVAFPGLKLTVNQLFNHS